MSSLEEGHLLGRYRVEAFLAQGGMGRVYRAVDTVLGRRVALKVLAGDQPPDSPAVARLLREARAAAALSHPNICSVFDVGEVDGLAFIAMELVQGASLRALLTDPATGLDQRLRWVHDLALALAAAHRAHVVHRDIKPDNVMVASDGRVRLLDFGVAKWDGVGVEPGPPGPGASGFRTADGQIVGTAGYMAPEQAMGGQVDARTDQFAWGVVAYETLSGQHPHGNGGFGEPALLSSLVPTLPFGVAAIVAKALAIEPSLRFADMDEIVARLQPLVAAAPAHPPPPPPPAERFDGATASVTSTQAPGESARAQPGDRRARSTARAIVLVAVIGGGAAATAIGVARWRGPAAPRPTIELRVEHIRRITFGDGCEEYPSFTPDGRAVIYDGDDGRGNFVVQRLDLDEGATPRELVHQDDPGWDFAPALSPTGDRVAFVHRGRQNDAMMVASLDGKQPLRVIGSSTVAPRWSADGRAIWANRNGVVGLYDLATGVARRVLSPPVGSSPQVLVASPDGTVVAQLSQRTAAAPSTLALFGEDGAVRWQVHDEAYPPGLVLLPGHVIGSRLSPSGQAELVAIPLAGPPIVSLASTSIDARDGIDVSGDRTRIVWSNCRQTLRVSAVDAAGRLVPALSKQEEDIALAAWIPGGRELVVMSDRTGKAQLWVTDSDSARAPRPLPIGDRTPVGLAVSPDATRFAVSVSGAGIGVGGLRGSPGFHMLTDDPGDSAPCFRKTGDAVVFTRAGAGSTRQVMEVPVSGGPPVALLGRGTHDAAISPVDDTIVYLADGRPPIVADAHGAEQRPLSPALSSDVFTDLRVSPDGTRVALLRANQELVEVDVARGTIVRTIRAGASEGLYAPFYGPAGLSVVRVRWQGNLFVADAAFHLPDRSR
jgi:Tol biopolymer transport system component